MGQIEETKCDKGICILGSTGSIGTQTLQVLGHRKVSALCAGTGIEKLKEQIKAFHPKRVSLWEEKLAKELAAWAKEEYSEPLEVYSGMDGLIECATNQDVEIVVAAIVGMIGIRPVMAAIEAGKTIALANKETLVTAGHLIMPLAKKHGVPILPVDSEHSAIFQCLQAKEEAGIDKDCIEKLILTASGGPFRHRPVETFAEITLEETLKHPNWSMGKKITVDSATMVNKGLEVIEAKWLFDVSFDQIEVVIQPQSIIHSMVQYQDGAVLAQLGTPDMRLPILYALNYPKRMPLEGERLDFTKMSEITFEQPDMERFPALELAYEVGRKGGAFTTIYNAANEWAVAKFLDKKLHYLDIIEAIRYAIRHSQIKEGIMPTLEEILQIEQETRNRLEKDFICRDRK